MCEIGVGSGVHYRRLQLVTIRTTRQHIFITCVWYVYTRQLSRVQVTCVCVHAQSVFNYK